MNHRAVLLLVAQWRQWSRPAPWIAGAWALLAVGWFFIAGQTGHELGWGWLPLGYVASVIAPAV